MKLQQITSLLYGQEINPETYAVCKADMLLKGEGESADHIVGGAEWSTAIGPTRERLDAVVEHGRPLHVVVERGQGGLHVVREPGEEVVRLRMSVRPCLEVPGHRRLEVCPAEPALQRGRPGPLAGPAAPRGLQSPRPARRRGGA